jgi:hypothetical protein
VLVLATLGAPPRAGRLRRRRPQDAPPAPPPEPVTTGRATLVRPEPLADPERWLRDADGEALAAEAIAALNRVLHAHRVASADPLAREVAREQALVVRIGVGEGEQVAEGRWRSAVALPPPPPPRRTAALRPTERLAAVLGGRDAVLACEDLVLRARADLVAGRLREAALQADVALRAGLAELAPWRDRADLGARLRELQELAEPAQAAAARALEGGLDDDAVLAVERTVARLEAALRARSAPGF